VQTRFHLWLARIISHEENALAILNGPALKWAAVAAALVMGLPILQQVPGITIGYICLVLIGVDVQYIACVRHAAEATGKARWAWSAVAALLFIPVFQTNAVFSLHAQTGIDELSAMSMIHLSSIGWGIERAFLIALLMGVSALSRPKQHMPMIAAPAPTAPDKPRGSTRRDIGRTVEETEALKRKVRPQVIQLSRARMSQRAIAEKLDITQGMVREIINESKQTVRRVS
jgi:hypothetical protein